MPEAGLIAQKGLKNTFFVKILPRHLVWLGYLGFCPRSNPPYPPPARMCDRVRCLPDIFKIFIDKLQLSLVTIIFPFTFHLNDCGYIVTHTCNRGLSWVLSPSPPTKSRQEGNFFTLPQQKVDRRQFILDRTQTVTLPTKIMFCGGFQSDFCKIFGASRRSSNFVSVFTFSNSHGCCYPWYSIAYKNILVGSCSHFKAFAKIRHFVPCTKKKNRYFSSIFIPKT